MDDSDPFIKVQIAWETLRDETTRRAYDRDLLSHSGAQYSGVVNAELDLDDMEVDDDKGEWKYSCRCGGEYLVTESELEQGDGAVVVGCSTCSLRIRVLYKIV